MSKTSRRTRASDDPEPSSQPASGALARAIRWGAPILALSIVLPYDLLDNQPQFLWQLFDELPPAAVVAALAPVAGAATLLVAQWRLAPPKLAWAVLATVIAVMLLHDLGADASLWGLLPLPETPAAQASWPILALALVASGSRLRKETRPLGRSLLVAAVAVALAHYTLHPHGTRDVNWVLASVELLATQPDATRVIGVTMLTLLTLWPLIVVVAGLWHWRRPPARRLPALWLLAVVGYATVMALQALLSFPSGAIDLFGAIGRAAVALVLVLMTAIACEELGRALAASRPPHRAQLRSLATAAAALVVLALLQWWLARPPSKETIAWSLGPATPAGDDLYRDVLPAWSRARVAWERAESPQQAQSVAERANAAVAAATPIDPGLAEAVAELTALPRETSTRHWYAAVAGVNRAARTASLPYYLDPRVNVRRTPEGPSRRLRVDSYRVEHISTYTADDAPLAALHVRSFASASDGHGLAGISRDVQSFALVALDATEAHAKDLAQLATEGRCGLSFEPDRAALLERCGALLAIEAEHAPTAVVAEVERHELQHQLDGPLLRLAPALRTRLVGVSEHSRSQVNRELSAYLAQLTHPHPGVKLGLVLPLRFALLQRGVYHHAAVLMFEALARALALEVGELDVATLATVFDALATLDDDGLRRVAGQAWEASFGDALPTLTANTLAP